MFLSYDKQTNKFVGFFPHLIENSIKVSEEIYNRLLANSKPVIVNVENIIKDEIKEITEKNFDEVITIGTPEAVTKIVLSPETKQLMSQIAKNQLELMAQSNAQKTMLSQIASQEQIAMQQKANMQMAMTQVAAAQLANMKTQAALTQAQNDRKTLLQQLAATQISNMEMSNEIQNAQDQNKKLAAQLSEQQAMNKMTVTQVSQLMLEVMQLKKGGK